MARRTRIWRIWTLGVVAVCWLGAALGVGAEPASALSRGEGPRSAKVSGQFYPKDPHALRRLVTDLLAQQAEPATADKPRILIVPHAGYRYSGSVAAKGFRQVQGHDYDGVVVVGFTHRIQFPGVSVETRDAVETPLGTLPVHQAAVELLLAQPGIDHVEDAHQTNEHSLEVELPFLQVALEQVSVVPILMGNADLDNSVKLADALARLARSGDYLFVFSTDLSHYHPAQEAEARDAVTLEAILHETPRAVHRLFTNGGLEACGRGPILAGVLLATRLGYPRRELLQYAHSGHTTDDRSRVVGYASIAMYDTPPVATDRLSPEAGAALVKAARRSLEQSLPTDGGETDVRVNIPLDDSLAAFPELSRANGLFVTLRTPEKKLRGCIGRTETTQPLRQSIRIVAVDAALHDQRFSPVTSSELSGLHVEVSVLTPPKKIAQLSDLVAGRDGVILDYQGRRGVFLPAVWESTGWTRVEFLRKLASQKAGLPPDAWQQATLYVFQDQVFEEPFPAGVAEAPLPAPGSAH